MTYDKVCSLVNNSSCPLREKSRLSCLEKLARKGQTELVKPHKNNDPSHY